VNPITLRVFVSSTWLDLKAERSAVEAFLQRFRETKLIGMEYFGSRDETTRQASLDEVDRSDVYVGIIAGRYGSGITEAEYVRARKRNLPCLLYFKQDAAIPPEGRDTDPEQVRRMEAFKKKIRDPAHGNTVTEFSGPQELASMLTVDLHNWMVGQYYSPVLEEAGRGALEPGEAAALNGDLRHLARVSRDSVAEAAKEKQRLDEWRRLVSGAFYKLTYDVPEALAKFPETAEFREHLVRDNVAQLERQYELSEGAHEVLRELATNHRLLAAILLERGKEREAYEAYHRSADLCDSLILLQPGNALYHRDLAVSHLNSGSLLEHLGETAEAVRKEYTAALVSATRAAELDPRWADLERDARSRLGVKGRARAASTGRR